MPRKFKNVCVTIVAVMLLLPQLAFAQQGVPAQPPAGGPPGGFMGQLLAMFPLFMIVFFIFYFMVIRPQEKRIRAHQKLIADLKKGDQVVTSSGMIGRVAGIEKDYILLEVSGNTKLKFEPDHVTKKFERSDKAKKSDSKAA